MMQKFIDIFYNYLNRPGIGNYLSKTLVILVAFKFGWFASLISQMKSLWFVKKCKANLSSSIGSHLCMSCVDKS